jgi:hypothetical protein
VKYLPLFHHFKAICQLPKHTIFLIKMVANASLNLLFFCNINGTQLQSLPSLL